ncbi:MAG TPA: hypothetical protein VMX57_01305 [Planctomycetota bacterium]|nr:hypothetical protein [Planctomycetota bacterium]
MTERFMSEPSDEMEPKTFSEEYVKTLRDENARRRLAEKTVRDELARARDVLGVSEHESIGLVEACETMRTRGEADRKLAVDALIEVELTKLSDELGLVDADAAFRLADRSAVKVDPTSRKVEGLREVLEALVKEKPWLAGRTPRAGSPGGGTPRSTGVRDDDSLGGRIRKQFARRLPRGLAVPGGDLGNLRITR